MAAYLVVDTALTHPDVYEQYKLKAKPLVEHTAASTSPVAAPSA